MSKKRKRRIWWVVGVSLSIVLFSGYVLGIGSGMSLRRELAEARRNGFPVEPEDIFIGPPPTDEYNAAPVYERMVQLNDRASGQLVVQSRHADALRLGYVDYDESKVREYLQQNAQLALLAEEAARFPAYRADKDWTDPYSVLLPEMALAKGACKILAARAMLSLDDGDTRAALDDLHRILVIAGHMEDAGFTIGHLNAFVNRTAYSSAVELMLARPNTDQAFVSGVLAQLTDWPQRTDWTTTLRMEAYANVWIPVHLDEIDYLQEIDYGTGVGWDFSDGLPGDEDEWESLAWEIPKTKTDAARLALEHWQTVLESYDPDAPDSIAWARKIDLRVPNGSGFWHASETLLNLFSVGLESSFGVDIRDRASRAVLESTLLTLAQQQDATSYSNKSVGTDPWTVTDLKFKSVGDGFMIYSVGRNGVDDGGDRTRFNDIVFEYPRLRQPAPPGYFNP